MTREIDDNTFPGTAVVFIKARWGSNWYTGSGVIVGKNDVLTASHVIFSSVEGRLADEILVYPSYDPDEATNPKFETRFVQYFPDFDPDKDGKLISGDFVRTSNVGVEKDIALLTMKENIGNSYGWFGIDWNFTQGTVQLIGYPGIYNRQPMWDSDYAKKHTIDNYIEIINLEVNLGNSGGPVYYENSSGPYLVGLVSTKYAAVSLSGHRYWLEDAMLKNDNATTAPVASTYTVKSSVSTSATAANEGSSVTFTIARSNSAEEVTVYWGTQSGTASAGAGAGDYTNYGVNLLVFAANESVKTITIKTLSDVLVEDVEYFYMNIYKNMDDAGAFNYLSRGVAYIKDVPTDSTAPSVTTFSPSDGAVGVSTTANITITFNEAIVRGTGSVVLKTAADITVATYNAATSSNLTINGSSLTINPNDDLDYGTGYKIELSADSIKDVAGNGYVGSANYDFATVAGQRFVGTSGNDTFNSTNKNETFDGTSGFDLATFNGNRASYTIAKAGNGFTVTNVNGTDGADTVINIERLKFLDKTVALDISGNAGQAYRVYQAAFDRKPDNGGLKYWVSIMDAGNSLEKVASGFIVSSEFSALYGSSPTNRDFVSKLYSNVLHRTPDQAGYDYWVNLLETSGVDKTQTLVHFSESNENQINVIGVIQNGIELT